MDDAELVAGAVQDLTRVLGPGPAPEWTRVLRWKDALADPRSLDRELVRSAQADARRAGVLLAAGGYLGGGLASCVADAELAAEAACLGLSAGTGGR
jgi:protoporphyrinogen oxidase